MGEPPTPKKGQPKLLGQHGIAEKFEFRVAQK
jgi:hypothetical protein